MGENTSRHFRASNTTSPSSLRHHGLALLLGLLAAGSAHAANGVLDMSYHPDVDGRVRSIALQPDGKAVIAGTFTRIGSATVAAVGRVNADGSPDTGFTTLLTSIGNYTVTLQGDGKVLVGGDYPGSGLIRLLPNGGVDGSYGGVTNSRVYCMHLRTDGRLLIGGAFSTVNGQPRLSLARLDPDGTTDSSFTTLADSAPFAMAAQSDGKVVLGGGFVSVGGVAAPRLARLNVDGSVDTGFLPPASPNGDVFVIHVLPDGRILIGGSFTSLGGELHNRIARLLPDGSLDPSFTLSLNGAVRSVSRMPNGELVIGGDFTTADTLTRKGLVRLRTDDSIDTTFAPNVDGAVYSTTVQGDGAIVVGGDFSRVNGIARGNIARILPDNDDGIFADGFDYSTAN